MGLQTKVELQKELNVQIANWSVLYTKLHQHHWYVKGPFFFTLHEKFEELYDEAGEAVDELAERLLAIGGKPVSTLKEFIETSTLQESTEKRSANDMVKSLVEDYSHINTQLKALAAHADELEDVITNDLAIDLIGKIEKHLWMLTAYLSE
ncbi:DNA starvation/stationary phase protection protein [Niallia circulans]|jgi:starvation-inducible DNA-binding protein|uniref:DNA starvation/stationary phase protection protein n=1 Tax=Niallia circulans TaxID=1397 RepID=A0A0J1I9M0_NIACI|nr:DNA starvation/stationary phase protection protein [Niallia circulans]AYV69109.1 DNA starvation/stationary phase protection protein [Niallia circulans]AYV72500.1 DNA starvation/stationary phase protection protein [Niallia circulans]KLV22671.1 general stress protein [Niallia circulans]MDR4318297.1 DNA starvation/stationary phase protection protein [Niallia circulans]MED3840467.1 DNA starvation/stationary phase protection protein [Niallia circulans]